MAINFLNFQDGGTPTDTDYLVGFNNTNKNGERRWTFASIKNALFSAIASQNNSIVKASTSEKEITFTGIPSTTTKIIITYNGVSTSGANPHQCRLGTSAGIVTTGYMGGIMQGGSHTSDVTSLRFCWNTAAAAGVTGHCMLIKVPNTNTWVSSSSFESFTLTTGAGLAANYGASQITLPGTLDRLQLLTVGGTDSYDAGSITVRYES